MEIDHKALFAHLTRRYGGVNPAAVEAVLCPVLIPIRSLDTTIVKLAGQTHFRGGFTVSIDRDCEDCVKDETNSETALISP
ncbi:MAG: hypothetical protein KGS61_17020 [Verrucomicrobia bacterium]|nr:hypothetical protein [Verrucomicrobiota bacterium]